MNLALILVFIEEGIAGKLHYFSVELGQVEWQSCTVVTCSVVEFGSSDYSFVEKRRCFLQTALSHFESMLYFSYLG
jgi:hypothetical protein